MKILKIENNNAYYWNNNDQKYQSIEQIDKDQILILCKIIMNRTDFSMDEFNKELIPNEAQQIIYKNIYQKLVDLESNKQSIWDQMSVDFDALFEKYKKEHEDTK